MDPRTDVTAMLRQWMRSHHGLVTRVDATRLGATRGMIRGRVQRGEWELLFGWVYRDATRPRSPHQTLLAGSLAAGREAPAVASHRSAAWLWGLVDRSPSTPEVTIGWPGRSGRGMEGLVIHRSRHLEMERTVVRREIPCTTAARTLVDLAAVASSRTLSDAVDRALAARLVTVTGVLSEVDRPAASAPPASGASTLPVGRPGTTALRQILAERGFVGAPHPSVLESKLLRLCRRYRLPEPAVELVTGRDGEYRLDLAYPDILLAVEVDGYAWHFTPEHQRRDHTRRNQLQASGWRLLVYTWRDVVDEPDRVAREVHALHAGLTAARA